MNFDKSLAKFSANLNALQALADKRLDARHKAMLTTIAGKLVPGQ